MSIFTKVAMNVLMNNSHPEIDRKQCWNLHPHKEQCTDCKDICPYGDDVFSRPNLAKDWDLCSDCGLCVSVCRTRCITPSTEQVQRDLSQAGADNDTVWLGCEQSARHNDIVRPCVGALCWEALAYLALCRKGAVLGGAGLPGPEQKAGAGPDPLRRVRERPLRGPAAPESGPSGRVFGRASL